MLVNKTHFLKSAKGDSSSFRFPCDRRDLGGTQVGEQISARFRKLRSGEQSQHGAFCLKRNTAFRNDAKRLHRLLQVFALLSILAAPAQLRAQVSGATLSGTVTDTTGTAIPRAEVSIKNVATGIAAAVTANSDGLYSAPNLLPGEYQVIVSAPGFATLV